MACFTDRNLIVRGRRDQPGSHDLANRDLTRRGLPDQGGSLRIGDRDREAATDRLSAHAAAGRLSTEELEERLDELHEARTAGELFAIERDLPRPRLTRGRRPGGAIIVAVIALVAAGVISTLIAGHPVPPVGIALLAVVGAARRGRWRGPAGGRGGSSWRRVAGEAGGR
jgi:Domain of unknown function (DUF1707)